jgi:siroheme synthase
VANEGAHELDFGALARLDTVVVLMGRGRLEEVATGLMFAGKDGDCPAACVESATTPQQRAIVGTLATIAARADLAGLKSPVVTVIGPVASFGGTEFGELVRSAVG